MHRLAADDAGDRAVFRVQDHPLAHQHLRIPAADGGEVEESVIVDVDDHQADLVDMPGQHDPRGPVGMHGGQGIPLHVGRHLCGESFRLFSPHPRRGGFEARWPGRIEQLLQECQGLLSPVSFLLMSRS